MNDITNCNLCGECNVACPVYSVLKKESAAPRFKLFLSKQNILNNIFFLCTDCKSCERNCNAEVKFPIMKARKELNDKNMNTKQNLVMKENIMLFGNPFGKITKNKKIIQYYT